MEPKKLALFLGIPLAGAALLAVVLAFREPGSLKAPLKKESVVAPAPVYAPARVEAAPKPAPPEKIAQATETVRIRGTYQNYRRAVAAADAGLQKAILPVLLKDRDAARQYAEEDLARAQSELDRTVAQRVLSDLRR